MAATTITRTTWTDGPSGTVVNNARLHADIYAPIDAILAGSLVIGGTISSEGFGTHLFSAGAAGTNILTARNSSAGTGNAAEVSVGNDSASRRAGLQLYSTTFTPSSHQLADGAAVFAAGVGGLSIATTHASAQMRFYTSGVQRMYIDNSSLVVIGSTTALDAEATLQVSGGSGADDWQLCLHHLSTGSNKAGLNFRIDTTNLWQVYTNSLDSNALLIDSIGTTRLRIATNGDVTPGGNGTQDFGSTSLRWNDLWANVVRSGDIVLDNGFIITEHDKVGIEEPGVAICRPEDKRMVAFLDRRGNLALMGQVRKLTAKEARCRRD